MTVHVTNKLYLFAIYFSGCDSGGGGGGRRKKFCGWWVKFLRGRLPHGALFNGVALTNKLIFCFLCIFTVGESEAANPEGVALTMDTTETAKKNLYLYEVQ